MTRSFRPFLFLGIAALGGSTSYCGTPGQSAFAASNGKIRKIDRIDYVVSEGAQRSYGGATLRWTGEGTCDQKEGQKPIIEVQGKGISVRNATIVESPDGIHVNARDVVIENMIFPDVCEDAITANNADNLVIRGCAFRGADDKAIQLNSGKNILIENCYFENCSKPIRVKKGATVKVRNCVAKNSTVFVFADGDGAAAYLENNRVDRSKLFVRAEKRAVIEVGPGNQVRNAEELDKASDGGRIFDTQHRR